MFSASRNASRELAGSIAIGFCAASIAVIRSDAGKLAAAAAVATAIVLCTIALRPNRWLGFFFIADLLLPPIASSLGGSGIHLAAAAALVGLFAGAMQLGRWNWRRPPLVLPLAGFVFCLLASVAFAVRYSGPAIAAGSILRIGLLLIGFYVFVYALRGPRDGADEPVRFAAFLFGLAGIAAGFACLDFYFHFPAPAGFSEQYVWLKEGVFRRAQGLFYDASTLGNFCSFFLIYAFLSHFERPRGGPRRASLWIGAVLLSAALILSYSRASVINFVIAAAVYAGLRGVRLRKTAFGIALAGLAAAFALYFFFPSFTGNYWTRFFASIQYFGERPDSILSGRLTNWAKLLEFIGGHPWAAAFGIGYKTLPYTNYLGDPLVADNTYLSLLAETGVVGLGFFLALLAGILRLGFRAARSPSPRAAFFGEWAFCFWCGQAVQMLSGDLLTYWRVLPLYFWVLGAAVRESEGAP